MTNYDSRPDTLEHILTVRRHLARFCNDLDRRAEVHDESKLDSPEVELFDKYTPLLKDTTYGSPEYKQFLVELKPALDHHYEANDHHPEHEPRGVNGMSLMALVEMVCDWKAASERHADGSFQRSLEVNKERFGLSDQLVDILWNTAIAFGWVSLQTQTAKEKT